MAITEGVARLVFHELNVQRATLRQAQGRQFDVPEAVIDALAKE